MLSTFDIYMMRHNHQLAASILTWLIIEISSELIVVDSGILHSIHSLQQTNDNTKEPVYYIQPEQVHLAFGDKADEIVITWTTFNYTPNSLVQYGEARYGSLNESTKGSYKLFIDGGPAKRARYIHRVKLQNLKPLTKYLYHCGSDVGWSPVFYFNTVDSGTDWSPKFIAFGDLANYNGQSIPTLQNDILSNSYAAVLHVGDIAYDLDTDNGEVGDVFMTQIAPIAGYVPYMVNPGNHESANNFSHYKNRFSMPGPYENFMYSWNLGPIHFISFNTEAYYYLEYGVKPLTLQYDWLQKDLAEANKPENRAIRPWIITYGHRPMYCSYNSIGCPRYSSWIRTGLPLLNLYGLEKMFYDYGVDFEIWAHEHSYSRLWPVYDRNIMNGSSSHPYLNPKGPVHITTGSAGSHDHFYPHPKDPLPWFAFRSSDYGYTRFQVFNYSHLYWEQVSINKGGEIIDSNWLIKETHGKY